MESEPTVQYLYCLVPGAGPLELRSPAVEGPGGVRVLACGSVGAVASQVPVDVFCGEKAEREMSDLTLLGPRVFRHEAVIEEAMRAGPVLPMRFATIFHSTQSLQAAIAQRLDAIHAYFRTIGDRQEWAVKGVLNRSEALDQLATRGEAAVGSSQSPGIRYFQERRARVQAERDLPVLLRTFREKASIALCLHSSDFLERSLPPDDGTPDAAIVFNWAFLVQPSELDTWRTEVERIQANTDFPLLSVLVSGPFPPYSFAPDLSQEQEV